MAKTYAKTNQKKLEKLLLNLDTFPVVPRATRIPPEVHAAMNGWRARNPMRARLAPHPLSYLQRPI